jgi:hypothetical protein
MDIPFASKWQWLLANVAGVARAVQMPVKNSQNQEQVTVDVSVSGR